LRSFVDPTDRLLQLVEGFMPESAWLGDPDTLTYLHSTVSTERQRVRVPEVPMHLGAVLADQPLTGGLEPMLGDGAPRMPDRSVEFPPPRSKAALPGRSRRICRLRQKMSDPAFAGQPRTKGSANPKRNAQATMRSARQLIGSQSTRRRSKSFLANRLLTKSATAF
jgi:hypothetical protein